ncbi:MAG: CRISPR-associated helicase Cas3' [Leptolyngbya sp. SIO1D8]|nr:CRISPR-associated helicase Cas3' [Leptolyngbya sp. SIO1D8]
MHRYFDFGRVFYDERQKIPNEILFQPLGNHVANVRKLAQYWLSQEYTGSNEAEKKASRRRVTEAAQLHDVAKPQKFGIALERKGDGIKVNYSFRGHRFEASQPDNPWVELLARGHHDFSAHDICRDAYKLRTLTAHLEDDDPLKKKAEEYKRILNLDPLAYAKELYILEMCDQIEAEVACRFFNNSDQAETRAFMDFTITQSETDRSVFFVDPWKFDKDEVELPLAVWSMPFPQELKQAVEKNSFDDKKLSDALKSKLKTWWKTQPKKIDIPTPKVTLRPRATESELNLSVYSLYEQQGFAPNPMQKELAEALDRNQNPHPAVLLKAPTGSGKTESIVFPALAHDYRLFLILPARSLLEDQLQRIDKYLKEFSEIPENQDRELSLVIDTGAQMDRLIYQNGEVGKPKVNPRRHLYKGNIILTTLDKFLYRYFSFGEKNKNFVFPHHIHKENCLFCFDEAHSYDNISFTNFESLVRSLYEAGRSLVLMTATMPQQLIESFDYLETIDYVDDDGRILVLREYQEQTLKRPYLNQCSFQWIENVSRDAEHPETFQTSVAQLIKDDWETQPHRRILAVVQTVKDAAAIYKHLKSQIETVATERCLFLYHGRLADQERPKIYGEIQQRDKDRQPYILITTSAIEVGCDLNAETLISQICPPENLIQRAGRCNRKGDVPDAKVILVGDHIPEFVNSLDEAGWETYQKTLCSLKTFDTKAIGACVSRPEHIDDYRVVEIFSMLHDYVYNADLTCQPSYEKGLVITRSWTPSATLIFDNGEQSDWQKSLSKLPKVSVPLDRLLIDKKDGITTNQYANVDVYERTYDKETTQRKMENLRWGSAYIKDIVIRIGADKSGAQLGGNPPYAYDPEIGFVDLLGIFSGGRKGTDPNVKLFHQPSDSQSKTIMITYINPLDVVSA